MFMPRNIIALLALAALAPAVADGSPEEHMREHFTGATLMQAAVVRADLEAVHQQAQWLARHPSPPNMPSGFSIFLENLHAHAKAAAVAENLKDAAIAVARTAASCGSCHAQGVVQTWLVSDVPAPVGDEESQRMERHQWAADRLWEGLIAPSDQAWSLGAEVLLEAPLELASDHANEQARALTMRMHELGHQASVAARSDDRVRVYGEFLGICADCHQLMQDP